MSSAPSTTSVAINGETDIVHVRQAAREAAVTAGFSLVQQTKLVTAASELARNTLIYGGGGRAEIVIEEALSATPCAWSSSTRGPASPT